MNPYVENVIAFLIISAVIYFSVKMVVDRIKAERELVDLISSKLSREQYDSMDDAQLKNFTLEESKSIEIKTRTIATYPLTQDSLYAQTAYMKRFRGYIERQLKED